MHDRTHNGVPFRILNVIDEYTRECLSVKVARRLTHIPITVPPIFPWTLTTGDPPSSESGCLTRLDA